MRARIAGCFTAVLLAGCGAGALTTAQAGRDESDPTVTTVTVTTPTPTPQGSFGQLGPPSGPVIDNAVNGSCGTELWAKKTLQDPASSQIDSTPIMLSGRAQLDAVPDTGAGGSARVGIELHIYQFTGQIVEAKQEADSDFHVILRDSTGKTLVTELPAPQCVKDASPTAVADMDAARAAFLQAFGQPSASGFTQLSGTVTVVGVGFYDRDHGQTARDSLGDGFDVELHPILRFSTGG